MFVTYAFGFFGLNFWEEFKYCYKSKEVELYQQYYKRYFI